MTKRNNISLFCSYFIDMPLFLDIINSLFGIEQETLFVTT